MPPRLPLGKSVLARVFGKVWRTVLGTSAPGLKRVLTANGCSFVYPFCDVSSKQASFGSAAWIYDFQHKFLPDLFSPDEVTGRDRSFSAIARHASTVVLSSKSAERDYHRFFPTAQGSTEVLQFHTFPNQEWCELRAEVVQERYHLPSRFFIICNQFWQHKNHLVVLEALARLRTKGIFPNVVCTGHLYDYRAPRYVDEILQTIHRLGIREQVFLLGLVPRRDQIQLIRRALAVVQPSLFEGWSTVVEDARCLGKRIIVSDLAVHREQDPPGSRFFSPDSVEALASALAEWWSDLEPGPDAEAEQRAMNRGLAHMMDFGENFLRIARAASPQVRR